MTMNSEAIGLGMNNPTTNVKCHRKTIEIICVSSARMEFFLLGNPNKSLCWVAGLLRLLSAASCSRRITIHIYIYNIRNQSDIPNHNSIIINKLKS